MDVHRASGGRARRALTAAVAIATALAIPAPAGAAVVGSHVVPSYQTNGRVDVVAVQGTVAYIGGSFTSVRPAGAPLGTGEVARNHAAAIDLTTGNVLKWNPNVSANVAAIDPEGSTVYLGGAFATVGGLTRRRLAEVDATSGAVMTAFHPSVNRAVEAIARGAAGLYIGGAFTTVGGAAQPYTALVDPGSGALVPGWAPVVDAAVRAITPTADGTKIVLGGNFQNLNGASSVAIGAVDPSTGGSLPWSWHPLWGSATHPFQIVSLVADANGVYAAGTGNGGSFMRLSAADGSLLFAGGVDGNVVSVTVMDGVMYAAGHFKVYCGPVLGSNGCTAVASRNKLIAVDQVTGNLQAWHPSANSSLGTFAVSSGGGHLAVGGDFTKIAGSSQQGFGEFTE
jgi:trimeric autotransporter adhesin